MIVSKIRGGLGNQLFQWAAGYALSQQLDTDLFLDLSTFDRNKARQFELDSLRLPFRLASQEQVIEAQNVYFYKQPSFHFDERFCDLSDGGFIRGYFNSEKYFLGQVKSIGQSLRNAVDVGSLNAEQIELLDKIKGPNSISVHVRRGDYVSNRGYSDFFGTCGLDYYDRAISHVESQIQGSPAWFVFSDDIQWCKHNLKIRSGEVEYVDVNSRVGKNYLDLFFMAACGNNIIANSTFSWWASWLNSNPDRIVVAPKKWFARSHREKSGKGNWIKDPYYDLKDLWPQNWVKL